MTSYQPQPDGSLRAINKRKSRRKRLREGRMRYKVKAGDEKTYQFTIQRPDNSSFEQEVKVIDPEGLKMARHCLRLALDEVDPCLGIASEGKLVAVNGKAIE